MSAHGPMSAGPDATLQAIRHLLARNLEQDPSPSDAHRLVRLVDQLDRWIVGGGVLPARWAQGRVLPLPTAATDQPWWQVRPNELAARYGCDPDRLRDGINPEDLSEWQFDLVMAALAIADERMATIRIPEG